MHKMLVKGLIAMLLITPFTGSPAQAGHEVATFAGGCFWCVESAFEAMPGVVRVVSGYTGGTTANPTYEEVCGGATGHAEAVQVTYDPAQVSYEELLETFWRQIDPTDAGGQFVDRGSQYRSEIFYHTEEQKRKAEASRASLQKSGRYDRPVVTPITRASTFYPAEEYHQDYHRKNPVRYRLYRQGSGRDQFLCRIWTGPDNASEGLPSYTGKDYRKPPKEEIRKRLSPLQFEVTQEEATEPPFRNEYWNNHREGIYVDVVSGEVLFSSKDKFDSGTGWPSFTRPLEKSNIRERKDSSLFMTRTEVRSTHADSHLGHVFGDGPAPTGLRYCINSAALRFIPRQDLEKEGYGRYLKLFER